MTACQKWSLMADKRHNFQTLLIISPFNCVNWKKIVPMTRQKKREKAEIVKKSMFSLLVFYFNIGIFMDTGLPNDSSSSCFIAY